jgi:hypothetical protein
LKSKAVCNLQSGTGRLLLPEGDDSKGTIKAVFYFRKMDAQASLSASE